MSKDRTEMEAFIGFKVPKKWREDLEQYARQNGYTLSYVVRRSVEMQVLNSALPLQSDLWKDFLEWRKDIHKSLERILTALDYAVSLLGKHDAQIGHLASIQKETLDVLRSLNNRL